MSKDNTSIGISACLLGHSVRYDGANKIHRLISTKLCSHFSCVPICPEVSIGLAVPREPLNLVFTNYQIQICGSINTALDVTDQIRKCVVDFLDIYPEIGGFVFKSRSPSCGLDNVAIYSKTGQVLGDSGGIFSTHLRSKRPILPVIEDSQLVTPDAVNGFILQVRQYVKSTIELKHN